MQYQPHRKLLTIWRMLASIASFFPAFFLSLFLPLGGILWIILNTVWIIALLFVFLYYFPRYLSNYKAVVSSEQVLVYTGVFYANIYAVPCKHIQFVTQTASPIERVFHLVSVRIVLAGGRLRILGLTQKEADTLTAFLLQRLSDRTEQEQVMP